MEFVEWVDKVLKHEGGFVNDPNDKGGATNFGITLNTYAQHLGVEPSEVSVDQMEALTREDAVDYYLTLWNGMGLENLPAQLRGVYSDMYVNAGKGGANRILQMAINTKLYPNDPDSWIDVDGIVGGGTRRALQSANLTALDYVSEQLMYYANNCFAGSSYGFKQRRRELTKDSYPENQSEWFTTRTKQNGFLRGWFRRAIDNLLDSGYGSN